MKPISPRRIKARKLAETVIQTVVNEQGTLTSVADKMPERFGSHKYKQQSVFNRVQDKAVQEEIRAIVDKINTKELADKTERKLDGIITKINENKPTAPQAMLMGMALKLDRRLVDQAEVKQTQHIDTSNLKAASKAEKQALLMELIRLESAGVEVETPVST